MLYLSARRGLFAPGLMPHVPVVVAFDVMSEGGKTPTSTLPAARALNSAESEVNGSSTNLSSFGLIGPEYVLFGTIVTLPVVSKCSSLNGPSTMAQSGFES